jgi:tetratricopeptide (TPR) repeat protein
VQVADLTVTGELALARGQNDAALAALRQAATIEDKIPYDEPPAWHAPVRQALGAALLAAGQPVEAEAVYRQELKRNPDNGWSLRGLVASLEAQGRKADAAAVEAQRARAWQHADVELVASTF